MRTTRVRVHLLITTALPQNYPSATSGRRRRRCIRLSLTACLDQLQSKRSCEVRFVGPDDGADDLLT